MTRINTTRIVLAAVAALAATACTDQTGPGTADPAPQQGNATGGDDNTFDHPDSEVDVWKLLQQLQEQGPPRFTARVHGCPKIKYDTIGRLLTSRGVDVGSNADLSAGQIYRTSDQALGVANYAARQRENLELTTAAASKLFDIFVQAAPEIIAAIPTTATKAGAAVALFDANGKFTADGLAFLQGAPATQAQMDLANNVLTSASTPAIGQTLAVATLLAASHTCE
jgi:hypothetical protein